MHVVGAVLSVGARETTSGWMWPSCLTSELEVVHHHAERIRHNVCIKIEGNFVLAVECGGGYGMDVQDVLIHRMSCAYL